MEFPYGQAWDYPGFPSLTVSYYTTNDFFFSGHVGVLTILALDNYTEGRRIMMWVAFVSVVIEFLVMIFLRGHYTIDLVTGILIGHYMWMMSKRLSRPLDRLCRYKRRDDETDSQVSNDFAC
jgi:hypothetical protein